MRRILFYAVNGLGLGHVTRLLAIARKVRRFAPDVEVLFVTSSDADNVIYREGFAAIKVPSKSARETAGLSVGTYIKTVQSVVWNVVSSFDPDTIVVDTFPTGSLQELLPILSWRARKVFIYREQRPAAARGALFQSALKMYDQIIVPHSKSEEDLPMPKGVPATYVGAVMIRDRGELLSRREARACLALDAVSTIGYAAFGGGGDPEGARLFGLIDEIASQRPAAKLVFGAGPLARSRPETRAAQAIADDYPAMERFAAFDFAISAAGYNTAHELLHTGTPAIYIPLKRGLDDQESRAERIAAAGAGIAVPYPDRESLSAAWDQLLDPRERARMAEAARALVPRNGASVAARVILA